MGKIYAVKRGFDNLLGQVIENKLYDNWTDCKRVVTGVKGAKYKSFTSKEEADKYLFGSNEMSFYHEKKYPVGCPHIFVDGSFNAKTDMYAYAGIILVNDVIIDIYNGSGKNTGQRQITGECDAAVRGLLRARNMNAKQVVIFHDYNGVGTHVTGEWKRNSIESEQYFTKMYKLKQGIQLEFVKVPAHDKNLYNELVDEFAKEAIDVPNKNVILRMLENNECVLKAGNEKVYNRLKNKYGMYGIIKAYQEV